MTDPALRILALEPFYGGSHKAFLDQWQAHSCHQFTLLTLPGSAWKWRMRQGAIEFATKADHLHRSGERFDVLFASDMLNLAEFLGLLETSLRDLPTALYFHENQITYPFRNEQERDFQFGMTNITSALAATEVWFNSDFHRTDFLGAVPEFLGRMPGQKMRNVTLTLAEKVRVESPGVEPGLFVGQRPRRASQDPLRIVWAARWEHDKDPATFFSALSKVEGKIDFRLAVLGESFREKPAVFEKARERFAAQIEAWGFQESCSVYEELLRWADVIVSTARHEFFGLSVVEAMASGAVPILPNRLSYPELLAEGSFSPYDGEVDGLVKALIEAAESKSQRRLSPVEVRAASARYSWSIRAASMDQAVARLVRRLDPPKMTS